MAENSLWRMAKRLAEPLRPRLRPGVLIIGAQKAGTSALFEMLVRHPKVLAPVRKELDFFNDDRAFGQGLGHYLRQFPVAPLRGSGHVSLDASPSYLSDPRCADRIRQAFPGIPLVAVLRDPVKRAFSAWNMYRDFASRPGREQLVEHRTFEEAIDDELAGRSGPGVRHYLAHGHYAAQLRQYRLALSEGRLLLFGYSAFRDRPREVVDRVLMHMRLDPAEMPADAYGIRSNRRPYHGTLTPELKARCEAHCAPWQDELEELLGRAFPL